MTDFVHPSKRMHDLARKEYAAIALVPLDGKGRMVQVCGIVIAAGKVVSCMPLSEAEDIPFAVSRAGVEGEDMGSRWMDGPWPPNLPRSFTDEPDVETEPTQRIKVIK